MEYEHNTNSNQMMKKKNKNLYRVIGKLNCINPHYVVASKFYSHLFKVQILKLLEEIRVIQKIK